jgi:hypothetical protein
MTEYALAIRWAEMAGCLNAHLREALDLAEIGVAPSASTVDRWRLALNAMDRLCSTKEEKHGDAA